MTDTTNAQDSTSFAKLNLKILQEAISLPKMKVISGSDELKVLRTNEINIRAIRDFIKEYKNVSEARWYISGNGFLAVYFTNADITTRRYYNKKGVYEYMIRYYNEIKLPRNIRHLIKTQYYDFDIFQITEFSRKGKIAYLTKIHDKDHWKTIVIVENEMEVVDEYPKR